MNRRRLRVYPWLIGAALWGVWIGEILTRRGWQGGLGPILGSDFITLYGAGLLYRHHPARLYDPEAQAGIQAALIAPTPYPGLNPFISPPYVAMACSLLTLLPLPIAFALWNGLTLAWTLHAATGLRRLLPEEIRQAARSFPPISVLLLSFFPFMAGWRVGQNHGLTLWLVTWLLINSRARRPGLAGLIAGLMLYKPQFVLGFLILWMAWKEWRALAAFGATTLLWLGLSLLTGGGPLYGKYLAQSSLVLSFPWVKGFPAFALITPYGLLATLLPPSARLALQAASALGLLLLGLGLAHIAASLRNQPWERQAPAWVLAILYPLLAFPYALLHDLMLLAPAMTLWAARGPSRRLLRTAIGVYLGALVFSALGALTRLALPALLPLGVGIAMAREGVLSLRPWEDRPR
ncbi:glycosyltransferase family 87 protein [Thermoflexus sp.]|uniref:glycosyltransferase family 87 protein n=1 Tax=Thermoflexus sp. TaxID=1969742 RepID=UPI001853AA43|nr:glycosyltransferase family 87 protein [Thermoflexus sp.]